MRPRRNDWFAIAAFALVALGNQMLWLTFAPVTTGTAAYYGVSEGRIGLLSEIFPLLYVVLAVPAGLMLDRWMRPVLSAAAALTAAGGLLRLAGDSYAWLVAGQILLAVAQPAILGAVTKIADERLEPVSRPRGISLGSSGLFLGPMVSLALGPIVGVDNGPRTLMWIGAAVASVALLMLLVALRRPGAHEAELSFAPGLSDLRAIWGNPLIRRLSAIAFMGFGIFVAMTTWLQVLLEPRGINSDQAGWLLVGMTLAGTIGALVLPTPVVRRGREGSYLRVAASVTAVAAVVLAVTETIGVTAAAVAMIGFFLLGALPVLLDLVDRSAGGAGASAATAIWLCGNAGGIVLALLVQALVHRPAAAFLLLAVLITTAVPLASGDRSAAP
ncbi:MAG: MFS transporter [Actinobacteria bacterium]|nr:MFS transporter [Actinomycetota bacterium]